MKLLGGRQKGRVEAARVFRLILLYSRWIKPRETRQLSALVMWFLEGSDIDERGPMEPISEQAFAEELARLGPDAQALAREIFHRGDAGWAVDWPAGAGDRPAIPRAVKKLVLERDGRMCRLCAATRDLHFDHIKAWSRGGDHDPANLQVLCRACNIKKGVL